MHLVEDSIVQFSYFVTYVVDFLVGVGLCYVLIVLHDGSLES